MRILDQRHLDLCLAPPAFQLGRDHLGVIADQHVSGFEEAGQVADGQIAKSPRCRHMQQPGGIPRVRRVKGDPAFRQGEVEIGKG